MSRIVGPHAIPSGAGETIAVYGTEILSFLPGSGTTFSFSYVDSAAASEHDAVSRSTVTSASHTTRLTEWPYIRVTSSGGTTRVAAV